MTLEMNHACRFCRHPVGSHNSIEGCPHCKCAGTRSEARPRTSAEMSRTPYRPHMFVPGMKPETKEEEVASRPSVRPTAVPRAGRRPKPLDPQPKRQDTDGQTFVSYYDTETSLGFFWDGVEDHIQVNYGGSSEDLVDTLTLGAEMNRAIRPQALVSYFRRRCSRYVEEWKRVRNSCPHKLPCPVINCRCGEDGSHDITPIPWHLDEEGNALCLGEPLPERRTPAMTISVTPPLPILHMQMEIV